DITPQHQAEAELRASREEQRTLATHQTRVREQEREAIAREIHDDVGGVLTALRFDLSWIERNGDSPSAERAGHAMKTLALAMQSTQRIQRNLRPPVLDAGLLEAMRWQIDEFRRRTGIETHFTSNAASLALDPEPALCVYRTLQEALTNVAKHASGANSVRVDLMASTRELSLEIADDGIGLEPRDLAKPASFGLRGLSERARRSGGWIDVSPQRRGTCVLLSIPLEAGDAADARQAAAPAVIQAAAPSIAESKPPRANEAGGAPE
ncbi:MAG: sensor histidine kinase, partial [Gammaproteobacteria bacterium]